MINDEELIGKSDRNDFTSLFSAVKLVPRSIDHSAKSDAGDCNASLDAGVPMAIAADSKGKVDITYSYTVSFVIDNSIKWSSRYQFKNQLFCNQY